MTDSAPPIPSRSQRPQTKRPAYFVVALVFVWLLGLFGWMGGCHDIDTLRHPDIAREMSERSPDPEFARKQTALVETLLAHRQLIAPLSAAEFLLGCLLTFTAASALWGKRRSRSLLVQAMVAYAAFIGLEYVLRRPVRSRDIDTLLSDPQLIELTGQSVPELTLVVIWIFRMWLGLRLAVLAGGLLAVTRPRVRALFADSANHMGEQEP